MASAPGPNVAFEKRQVAGEETGGLKPLSPGPWCARRTQKGAGGEVGMRMAPLSVHSFCNTIPTFSRLWQMALKHESPCSQD